MIRQKLLNDNASFTYETVMSHPGKIDFMKKALENDYRVYLYFIATEDTEINLTRIKFRVQQHGHKVLPEKTVSRYPKTMDNLKAAVKQTSRAFIFDNTLVANLLIAEVTDGTDIRVVDPEKAPGWIYKYLLE